MNNPILDELQNWQQHLRWHWKNWVIAGVFILLTLIVLYAIFGGK